MPHHIVSITHPFKFIPTAFEMDPPPPKKHCPFDSEKNVSRVLNIIRNYWKQEKKAYNFFGVKIYYQNVESTGHVSMESHGKPTSRE